MAVAYGAFGDEGGDGFILSWPHPFCLSSSNSSDTEFESALLWGRPVPPAPGLRFPIFKITKIPSLVLGEKGSTATLSPCQIFTNGPDEDGTHGIGQNARGRAVLVFIRPEGVVKASRSRKLNGRSQNQPASEKPESDPSQLPWREVGQRESQTRGVID